MEMTTSSLYATTILLLLQLLPLTLSISHRATNETSFVSCLHRKNVSDTIITSATANATDFGALLNSTIQNPRILTFKSIVRPLLIVSPTGESHVQHVVTCARHLGIRVRVRSGGHDYEGLSYVSYSSSPFVLLDLTHLRSVSVNKTAGTAWVQAGATLGELYYAIGEKAGPNYGFPAGTCPTLGIGGHLGGGGIGAMHRAYGVASDNIVDAQLVNVFGEIKDRKSMGEDLFWAIRGGGAGSFGVILSYKVKLVHVPTVVTVLNLDRTLADGATKLVTRWQHVAPKLDERLFIRMILSAAGVKKVNRTVVVTFNMMFLGGKKELVAVMNASFPELGLKEKDCREMSWVNSTLFFSGHLDLGRNLSALLERGRVDPFFSSFKAKSDFFTKPISEEVWDEIFSKWFVNEELSPILVVEPLGGRMDAIAENEIPFPHRNGYLYIIQYLQKWGADAGLQVARKRIEMSRRLYEFMGDYASKNPRAAYLNYRDLDLGRNRYGEGESGNDSYWRASAWGKKYFGDNYKRLAYVKAKVDPDNYFRNEQSVPPRRFDNDDDDEEEGLVRVINF